MIGESPPACGETVKPTPNCGQAKLTYRNADVPKCECIALCVGMARYVDIALYVGIPIYVVPLMLYYYYYYYVYFYFYFYF